MSTILFVINCNGEDRYRVKRRTIHDQADIKIVLERLGPNGWHMLDTESLHWSDSEAKTIQKMIDRTRRMYGSPAPTELILHSDQESVFQDHFEEKYGIKQNDRLEVDYTEVEVMSNE